VLSTNRTSERPLKSRRVGVDPRRRIQDCTDVDAADVQTPLKEIFVLSLLQHYLILLVCNSDSVVVLAVAFAA